MTVPHRSALYAKGPGFAMTVLPASPYQVSYVPPHHVIGFTFERQRGVDAFGGARRRPFDAEPWRLAFTPAGCSVFSASDRGGEYLVLSVAPETFTRLAPGIATDQLPQFTNVADPLFTPLRPGCGGPRGSALFPTTRAMRTSADSVCESMWRLDHTANSRSETFERLR